VAADGTAKNAFTFPFITIEAVLILDNNRLLVINDNNYPGPAGREFGVPDNNEFIVIHTAPLLKCNDGKGKDKDKYDRWDDRGHDHDDKECRPARE
jgi:hypothetical protein